MQPCDQQQQTGRSRKGQGRAPTMDGQIRGIARRFPEGVKRLTLVLVLIGVFVAGCEFGGVARQATHKRRPLEAHRFPS